MTTRETLTKLADLLDGKANVCSAEAILAQRSGEDPAVHQNRAKSARFYAAACRTAAQEMEVMARRLAVRTKRGAFVPPTVEDANAYGKEIGLPPAEIDSFRNHFESNGWRVGGKAQMACWKAAMRRWLTTYRERHPSAAPKPVQSNADPEGWRAYLATREIAYQPFSSMSACIRHDFREKCAAKT